MELNNHILLPDETIIRRIYVFRNHKVMLDSDLAELYGVETRVLNQAVKRNMNRFPEDFMFQLNESEFENLISQFVISSSGYGGRRKLPYVFTEQGIAMLSSVLSSPAAVEVNIRIIRIFTRMRELVSTNKDILLKLEQLERQVEQNSRDTELIFQTLRQLLEEPEEEARKQIGYKSSVN
jgi:hypothetical protein